MAEQKIATGQLDMVRLTQVLSPIVEADLDVLVLGCTHFPMLRDELQQVLGQGVTLLDSGEAIAKRVKTLLAETKSDEQVQEEDAHSNLLMQAFYTKAEISEGLATTLVDCGFSTLERITTINSNG